MIMRRRINGNEKRHEAQLALLQLFVLLVLVLVPVLLLLLLLLLLLCEFSYTQSTKNDTLIDDEYCFNMKHICER